MLMNYMRYIWICIILICFASTGCGEEIEEPSTRFEILERESKIPSDAIKMTPETDDYPPQLHSNEYEDPVPMPYPINTAGAEDSPFILPDGKTLYFVFVPDVRVPPEKQIIDGVSGIYVSKMVDNTWSKPERVLLNDDISLDGCQFIQGNILWFCSVREGYPGVNWFTTEYIDGKWQNWQYAGDCFDPDYEVGELHMSADGKELYFHSARPGGKGKTDIWVTKKVNGKWQTPKNVAAVNTEEDEGMPFLSQDGKELWFNRKYMGSPAIFRSRMVDGQWSDPELILSWFAGEPSLNNQGNIYFVHHYYKDRNMIEADIYVAKKK